MVCFTGVSLKKRDPQNPAHYKPAKSHRIQQIAGKFYGPWEVPAGASFWHNVQIAWSPTSLQWVFFRTKPHRNSRTLPVSLTSSTWALVPVTWRSGRCRLCKPRTSRRDARSPVIASLRLRSRTLSLVRFLRMANTEMGSRAHGPLAARLLWQSSLSGKACSPCWSALQL